MNHYYIVYKHTFLGKDQTITIGLFTSESKAILYIEEQPFQYNVKYSIEGIDVID